MRMYGCHFDAEELCLIIFMELLSNRGIGIIVRRMNESLPESITKSYANQLVSAVSYVRSRSVVHRDIKCGNLLVTQKDTVKLSDFSFSKKMSPNRGTNTITWIPVFLSPEVLSGD
ncbi:hypothetical protein DQ04_00921040 [Trypanosoma grayi]|uniref:hypothetical protein n=1 Tax=Trypanosoma grayi TaxID=71804 RepID=UPI0004F3F10A|nr:hypothetical protein DQ04_00921040 [Trypanosoma grayi]KEG13570.1 hypothetical protein DQ04_00921040 [Trypanosoma grayi]